MNGLNAAVVVVSGQRRVAGALVVLAAACALAFGAHVEHWLNGQKVVGYELGGELWKAKVAAGRFAAYPGFGKVTRGFLGVVGDRPGSLTLRRVKARPLP